MSTPVIKINQMEPEAVEIPTEEVLRYLGCRAGTLQKEESVDSLKKLVSGGIALLKPSLSYKACYLQSPVSFSENGIVRIGGLELKSRGLFCRLEGGREAVLFAATIGVQAERLMQREAKLHPAMGMILDAVGSAAVEAYCDRLEEVLRRTAEPAGWYLRERYSPGYGDLSLAVQNEFLQILDAFRKIGIGLTDRRMMVPSKSVTAIIGLSRTKEIETKKTGCAGCGNVGCAYRKE